MPLDTDNDGQNNAADTEDDGDDVPDSQDAFPLDETESVDTDGDGIGNNADPDDDDDGVLDIDDDDPLDPEVGAPGGNSTVIIAVAVIAVLAVVGILVYMLVIKPKP
jgi:microbial collagenase